MLYLIYRKYTTITSLKHLTDLIYSASHLFRELDSEYVLQSLLAKNYSKYIRDQISKGLKKLKETGVISIDDHNLMPFFKALSYSGSNKKAVDDYALNVNALLNIHRYVDDEIVRRGLKPYSDYTVLYLIFIPLILASGYIMGFIAIPIIILFKFVKGFNLKNLYTMNMSNWQDIWNIPSPNTLLPIPSLSLSIFNLFTLLSVSIIFIIGVIKSLSRYDYNPIELVKYSALAIGFNILIYMLSIFIRF